MLSFEHIAATVSLPSLFFLPIIRDIAGSPDSNAIHTVANARAAGISYVDVYMFPSPRCSRSPSEQVGEMGKITLRTIYILESNTIVVVPATNLVLEFIIGSSK